MKILLPVLTALLAGTMPGAETLLPFESETLHYAVNWPSGLSLGEAKMSATKAKPAGGAADRWEFELKLDAAVPGFSVADTYRSTASDALCSTLFEKDSSHGARKTRERTTFDHRSLTATRETLGGGGKSEFSIPACARDALSYLYYVRSELVRGRIPPSQGVYFGGSYDVQWAYGGRQNVRAADTAVESDRMVVTFKGKASNLTFEIFFGLDAARRPVLIRVPLQMGAFSMQLVP